jgi:hypothetical protein
MKLPSIAVFGFALIIGCSSNTQIVVPTSTLPALKESEVTQMGGKKKPLTTMSLAAKPQDR